MPYWCATLKHALGPHTEVQVFIPGAWTVQWSLKLLMDVSTVARGCCAPSECRVLKAAMFGIWCTQQACWRVTTWTRHLTGSRRLSRWRTTRGSGKPQCQLPNCHRNTRAEGGCTHVYERSIAVCAAGGTLCAVSSKVLIIQALSPAGWWLVPAQVLPHPGLVPALHPGGASLPCVAAGGSRR